MYPSPFNTTPCKNHKMADIEASIKPLLIDQVLRHDEAKDFKSKQSSTLDSRVYLVDDNEPGIKPFAHPIVMEIDNHGTSEKRIIADVRAASRIDKNTGALKGSADLDYLRLRCRIMDLVWIDDNSADLLNMGDFQIKVFSRLLSENISRRMNLQFDVQMRMQVIAAYYYICMFYDEVLTDETSKMKIAKRIGRSIQLTVPNVLLVLDEIEPMYTIGQFTETLRSKGQSIRLEKLTPGLIYNMLGGIWYGSNAVEQVAVALEHPPTFVSMLHLAMIDRGYRKTILGQIVLRYTKDDLAKTFTSNLKRMLSQ